ncbi:MAG: di-trans,poly-cis-decaprenylcistransferase [Candidatus Diapherotrites archaeon]|nr:di-trans,poly-cis-decaprenylcistransferase [Candidatus Diapherotrites archaeon]
MLDSIAFIPDGNRRYAKKYNISLAEAYAKGFNKVREALDWSLNTKPKIKEASIWGLSTENLQRDGNELFIFLRLLRMKLKELLNEPLIKEHEVRVKFAGRIYLLPDSIQKLVSEVTEATKDYSQYTINIFLGYGGRAEIIDAVQKLISKGLPVTEENLTKCLYVPTSPDLIIRTGNTQRLSGFMPWQSAYSELYFSEKLWPEFSESDFDEAIAEYRRRERRFGR